MIWRDSFFQIVFQTLLKFFKSATVNRKKSFFHSTHVKNDFDTDFLFRTSQVQAYVSTYVRWW